MSFANFDYEAQKPLGKNNNNQNSGNLLPENELDTILNKTSVQLKGFLHSISQLDIQRKNIGTRRDGLALREKADKLASNMKATNEAINKLVSELDDLINQKQSNNNDKLHITNKQMVTKQRLVNEYHSLNRQFEKSLNLYNVRKKDNPLQQNQYSERTPLLSNGQQQQHTQVQVQQQVQVQDMLDETELQAHILLTEERNQQIDQIAGGVQEINEIYKELYGLVQQQGEQIDTIEDNVLQLQDNSQQAHKQLLQANELQRKKGRWSCILLTGLCILVLIIVLAVIS
ncbi:t-SNARE [Scheffersomyces coipomensis]|uniref:t-SNARE n=1 Tax=Scheffersomyces coipomensis TaxID=1788519 RepID=UPI00315CF9EA